MRRFVTEENMRNPDDHIIEMRWSEFKTNCTYWFVMGIVFGFGVPAIIYGLFNV